MVAVAQHQLTTVVPRPAKEVVVVVEVDRRAPQRGLVHDQHAHLIGDIQVELRINLGVQTDDIDVAGARHLVPRAGVGGRHLRDAHEVPGVTAAAPGHAIELELPIVSPDAELTESEAGALHVQGRVVFVVGVEAGDEDVEVGGMRGLTPGPSPSRRGGNGNGGVGIVRPPELRARPGLLQRDRLGLTGPEGDMRAREALCGHTSGRWFVGVEDVVVDPDLSRSYCQIGDGELKGYLAILDGGHDEGVADVHFGAGNQPHVLPDAVDVAAPEAPPAVGSAALDVEELVRLHPDEQFVRLAHAHEVSHVELEGREAALVRACFLPVEIHISPIVDCLEPEEDRLAAH